MCSIICRAGYHIPNAGLNILPSYGTLNVSHFLLRVSIYRFLPEISDYSIELTKLELAMCQDMIALQDGWPTSKMSEFMLLLNVMKLIYYFRIAFYL